MDKAVREGNGFLSELLAAPRRPESEKVGGRFLQVRLEIHFIGHERLEICCFCRKPFTTWFHLLQPCKLAGNTLFEDLENSSVACEESSSNSLFAMFGVCTTVLPEVRFGLEVEAVHEVFLHGDQAILVLLVLRNIGLLLVERSLFFGLHWRQIFELYLRVGQQIFRGKHPPHHVQGLHATSNDEGFTEVNLSIFEQRNKIACRILLDTAFLRALSFQSLDPNLFVGK
mmetsp:Transcript_38209/g.120327  ORF Transcript_38209/g.120327 Transcript_38209/m.120327 type:complete len:228 (+) Transcript_38209:758-1441(+)